MEENFPKPQKLSADKLSAELKNFQIDFPLYFFEECDSTNTRAAEIQKNGETHDFFAVAASQNAGRGRFDRKWIDETGKSICISAMLNVSRIDPTLLGCFGVLAGVEICNALRGYCDADLKLKWPNDIYCDGKKLAGMIASLNISQTGEKHILFGIGINFAPIVSDNLEYASLAEYAKIQIEINECAALAIASIYEAFDRLVCDEADSLQREFAQIDYLRGKEIAVNCAGKILQGEASGIDEEGRLILRSGNKIFLAGAGEASIIKQ